MRLTLTRASLRCQPNRGAAISNSKRALGSFYTQGNPFVFKPFATWFAQLDKEQTLLEPFSGSGQIAELLSSAGYQSNFKFFDIDPTLQSSNSGAQYSSAPIEIHQQDTIANFPTGFQATITNPPYLSFHFAKRKGLNPTKEYFEGFDSLYQTAISKALANCDFVAMIIPESFVTSGLFTERLQSVISLPFAMFSDTDMPTCLALWGPKNTDDFELWRGSELLGDASELTALPKATECKSRIVFNSIEGNVGLRAIDNSFEPSLAFCHPHEIPIEKVKNSARLLTRISVAEISEPNALIEIANRNVSTWREATQDVCLTAFKGLRKDGRFRRRLDYANARALLSQAICELEQHQH